MSITSELLRQDSVSLVKKCLLAIGLWRLVTICLLIDFWAHLCTIMNQKWNFIPYEITRWNSNSIEILEGVKKMQETWRHWWRYLSFTSDWYIIISFIYIYSSKIIDIHVIWWSAREIFTKKYYLFQGKSGLSLSLI